jgi:hypothetical protein
MFLFLFLAAKKPAKRFIDDESEEDDYNIFMAEDDPLTATSGDN